jgi:hypothetical protein
MKKNRKPKYLLPKRIENDLRRKRVLTKFIKNTRKTIPRILDYSDMKEYKTSNLLEHTFVWSRSSEGHSFWSNIHKNLLINGK